jgi:multiple sugar transport system ATP-binding protein
MNDVAPKDRDIAMVFQNYALYPHMTVEQNLGFGLRLRKEDKAESARKVAEAARTLGLEPLLKRRPSELSGGQRQRVAMGRAIVRNPQAFLMDEPLSNLDAKLRVQMRSELSRLHQRFGTTTVYVTHDQVEAMTLGDRVVVMRDGVVQQVDTPQNLYHRPANLFVAAFIGSPPMNLVEATVRGDQVEFGGHRLPLPAGSDAVRERDGERVVLGLRPADLEDCAVWEPGQLPSIEVQAEVTEKLGSEVNVIFGVDEPPLRSESALAAALDQDDTLPILDEQSERARFVARVDSRSKVQPGGTLRLSVDPDRFYFFDPSTGTSLLS